MFIKISVILNPEKLLNLVLLLAWSTVRGVCTNHEVVMFRPRTVTPPYLGSVVNCNVATPLFLPAPPFSALRLISVWGGLPAPAPGHSPIYFRCSATQDHSPTVELGLSNST